MRPRRETDVLAPQSDELGHAQTGLRRYQQERTVTAANPLGEIGSFEQGCDVALVQKLDGFALMSLVGDGKDTLAVERVRRLIHCDITEERVQRRQSHIPGARAVAPVALQVVEELADEGGVEVFESECAGLFAQTLRREAQQESKAIAVAGDGVRTGSPLREEPLGEE